MREWYTQPGAGITGRRRVLRILTAIDGLPDHPTRHPRDQSGRREFTVEGQRVRYRISPDTGRDDTAGDITVLRVFGPGQQRDQA